ncbi:chemotaxis protein CheW [Colwellia sp. KU-HH00111]|uniref:chemotaxis protein CheW n=1 Tax=Colwellia sp. KU-HH00111 TaxID=3127652 RepID=UPI0031070EB9
MAKPLAASKKVMKNYLSELLNDDPIAQKSVQPKPAPRVHSEVEEKQRLAALLKNVSADLEVMDEVVTQKSIQAPSLEQEIAIKQVVKEKPKESLVTHKSSGKAIAKSTKPYRQGEFQALFFDVAGLTVAVPLIELGGIHKIDKITSLMGKPNWFQGVMLHRDDKINVVDTALWVMPEKYDEKMKSSLEYQYIIMLSDSVWGLTAENLVDTITLQQDEVKWLDAPSKRPWLAGLVKDKMCALLDVSSLIQLLNDGSGINQDG